MVDDIFRVEGSNLLITHQTVSQKRLTERYDNNIGLLDATYKITKFPSFFVVVKTNVDYQVVASFAQDEKSETIMEALLVIKSWNKIWKPKCFMMDNCEAEINAVENIFPGKTDFTQK